MTQLQTHGLLEVLIEETKQQSALERVLNMGVEKYSLGMPRLSLGQHSLHSGLVAVKSESKLEKEEKKKGKSFYKRKKLKKKLAKEAVNKPKRYLPEGQYHSKGAAWSRATNKQTVICCCKDPKCRIGPFIVIERKGN